MPITFIAGDLFANAYDVQAFAHGCNCQGSMGGGIAVQFRARYPEMFQEYCKRCSLKPRQFNPGDVFLWKCEDKPWVFNLATQEHYRGIQPASLPAIEQSLLTMRTIADRENVASISMPGIGAGLGGLDWIDVRSVIERSMNDWPGQLIVYEKFVPQSAHHS